MTKMRIEPPLKVTVLVMTYNHASFIAQSLDSALAQRTDFDYEILISEDCSTDGTRATVISYGKRHPGKIRLLLSEQNLHGNAVVSRGINAARGQYVALLDGDDYWISPDKLQKQVDFLDAHPDCSICFHNARVIHEDGSKAPRNWNPEHQAQFSTFEDIWMGNFIATCATMFRRQALGKVPRWYDGMSITDWPLHVLNARSGRIGYINEVMGVYRYHSGGAYSSLTEWNKLETTLQFYLSMNSNLDYRCDALIRTAMSRYFFEWAQEYENRGDRTHARKCFKTSLRGRALNKYMSGKQLLRMFSRLYLRGRWRTA
jgi:glycosyltransferase involved in cell wall biosynthesis